MPLPYFQFPPPPPVMEGAIGKGSREEAMAAAAAGYAVDYRGSSTAVAGDYPHTVVKGKRTKRMRLLHALAPRAPLAASSFTASSSSEQSEVDTANSLIMLAERPVVGTVVESELRLEEGLGVGEGAEADAAAGGKAGSIKYQCRTCNKCFQSFQALGGHRAGHNKQPPLPAAAEILEKRAMGELDGVKVSLASSHKINTGLFLPDDCGGRTSTTPRVDLITISKNNHNHSDDGDNINNHSTTTVNSNKPRVHECAICGLEFSSGQALGGHMRRHRAPAPPKKERRSIFSLDLNLPAPMDVDEHESHSFGSSGKRPLIFLPSALVDCHH